LAGVFPVGSVNDFELTKLGRVRVFQSIANCILCL
jgi:hypothetical protein